MTYCESTWIFGTAWLALLLDNGLGHTLDFSLPEIALAGVVPFGMLLASVQRSFFMLFFAWNIIQCVQHTAHTFTLHISIS